MDHYKLTSVISDRASWVFAADEHLLCRKRVDMLCLGLNLGLHHINHGSTVVLQCYRRQSIPMEQWTIRSSVTLYPLNRLLLNLVRIGTPTHTPSFVKFRLLGNFPQIGEP